MTTTLDHDFASAKTPSVENFSTAPMNTLAAAQRLGMSVSFLNQARMKGTGPRYLKIGGRVRSAPRTSTHGSKLRLGSASGTSMGRWNEMARPLTDDHGSCDSAAVERGLLYLEATPRHLRGPMVPALKALGLSTKEACAAARLHHLKQAGGAGGAA